MSKRKITVGSSILPIVHARLESAAALNMRSVSAEIADRLTGSFDLTSDEPVDIKEPPAFVDTPGKRAVFFLKQKHPRVWALLNADGRYKLQLYVDGQV